MAASPPPPPPPPGPCAPLAEAPRRRVSLAHRAAHDPQQRRRFYDAWAPQYEQDVEALQYLAPQVAVTCLASAFQGAPQEAMVLDVACGTGLVAQELLAKGFRCLHGLDGSSGMLEHAHSKGLYQDLKLCLLGLEPLPAPEGYYDAITIVGALSEGQVPVEVLPELLRVTKPGGFLCLTTRSNRSNLHFKARLEGLLADLEQGGTCEKVAVQEVEKWEKATSTEESLQGSDFIPGVVYLYRKHAGTNKG